MIRLSIFAILLLVTIGLNAQEYRYNYSFYTNSPMPGDWYFSMSAAKEGSSVKNNSGKLPVSDQVFPYTGQFARIVL